MGVLAIIGVLSVGAIAGYSKAMMKYKLNKQAEQLNTLLNVMYRYKSAWKGIKEYIFLTPYFIKMGEISEDMIHPDDTNYIYDVFGNQIALRNNDDPAWNKIKLNYYISNKESFDLCQNIMRYAKEYSPYLYVAGAIAQQTDNMEHTANLLYGDNYCTSDKCLKDITMNDIYRLCHVCKEDEQTCLFQFLWKME